MAEESLANGTEEAVLRRRRAQVLDKLIGEAEPFVQIRDQLSRLSESEATVLISGGSGPEAHPGFIEFSGEATVRDGHRKVARAGEAEGKELI